MTETELVSIHGGVLRPLRRGNALEDTVSRLVQTIRLGVVAPGESLLSERELASRFGVSRDTVREAIKELAEAGFLVSRRGRYGGTFVADPLPTPTHPVPIEAAEFDDVLGMRRVLECGAAAASASRSLTAGERETLVTRNRDAQESSAADYRRLDTLLHLTIAELSGIPTLFGLVAENRARINEWLDTFPLLPRNVDHSDAQHEAVVTGILAGSPDAAASAMREHLAGSEALLRGFLA